MIRLPPKILNYRKDMEEKKKWWLGMHTHTFFDFRVFYGKTEAKDEE